MIKDILGATCIANSVANMQKSVHKVKDTCSGIMTGAAKFQIKKILRRNHTEIPTHLWRYIEQGDRSRDIELGSDESD